MYWLWNIRRLRAPVFQPQKVLKINFSTTRTKCLRKQNVTIRKKKINWSEEMFEWFIESNKKTAISTGKLLNETGIAGCANDFMRIRVAFSVDSLESVSNTVQNWTTNSSHKVIEIEDKLLIKTIYRKSGEITAFEDRRFAFSVGLMFEARKKFAGNHNSSIHLTYFRLNFSFIFG